MSKEKIIAEVHYAAEEYSWFAVGFSNYGELKPADFCILWIDWHRETHLEVFSIFLFKLSSRNKLDESFRLTNF